MSKESKYIYGFHGGFEDIEGVVYATNLSSGWELRESLSPYNEDVVRKMKLLVAKLAYPRHVVQGEVDEYLRRREEIGPTPFSELLPGDKAIISVATELLCPDMWPCLTALHDRNRDEFLTKVRPFAGDMCASTAASILDLAEAKLAGEKSVKFTT